MVRSTLAALAALPLLWACTMPQRVADEESATLAAGYGRAFGRVRYFDGVREVTFATGPFAHWSNTLTLFVRPRRGGEMQYMPVGGDGSFAWPLQAGDYVIVGFHRTRQGTWDVHRTYMTGRLMAAFSVPAPGKAVYVGDLHIKNQGAASGVEVLDHYDEALKRMEAKLAAGKSEPGKGLMALERPPGSYRRVGPICAPTFGLSCTENLKGVEPVQPVDTAWAFPITQSLTPLLEWKPSHSPGATYDVAIYESLSFMFGATGAVERMRGGLIDYAEALPEPRYTPTAPLAPGKKYEWTVRVRIGDAVSTWSTTSHSLYLVIAAKKGAGQLFGFETPAR
jgi:hypothetical protein